MPGFTCTAHCLINLIVAAILFGAQIRILHTPSQKDNSEKKDCPNRKAKNLLYKKIYSFFGAQSQSYYLSMFPCCAISLRCASGMPLRPGLKILLLQRTKKKTHHIGQNASFYLYCPLFNKPYCSGYPFLVITKILHTPSQKDDSEKKDCPNRKAKNLLY